MSKGIKRLLFCIFGTAFLLCLAAAAAGGAGRVFAADAANTEDNKFEVAENQFIGNGGFEGENPSFDWNLGGGAGEISTTEKHSGNNALKINSTKSVSYYGGSLPVFEAGQSYTLGVWAKFSNVSAASSFTYQYVAAGQTVYSGKLYFVKVTENKDWTYYESTYEVTNAGGQLTNIHFYNDGSCDLYIDDVALFEAHDSGNILSVIESQFIQIWNGEAVLNGWSNIGAATSGFTNYGINLFAGTNNESWNYEWPANLEPNTKYLYSFMYKVSDNSGFFYAYYQNSLDETWIGFTDKGLSSETPVADTDWKFYSTVFETGAGALTGGTHRFGFIRGDTDSTIIASNFSIVKVGEAQQDETFPNGGVEKGTNAVPEGWALVNNDAGVSLYQGEGYNGAGLVAVSNSAAESEFYIDSAATRNIPAEAGGAYKITFKMKSTGSPVKVGAMLYGDGDYTYVARSEGYFYESEGSFGWSDVTAYMVLDPNDTNVKNVALRLQFTKNAGETVQVCLDDFAIEKVAFVKITGGDNITRDYVKPSSEYTLPVREEAGKLVLYKAEDGTYYGGGEKITVTDDMNFTAETISYSMEDGAYIRVIDPSGIRFCTEIDASAVADGVKVGVRLTRGNSSDPFYIEGEKFTESEGVRKYSYALVNIDEANYNTEFTATAYIEISGKKIYLGTSVTRSVAHTAYLIKTSEGYADNFTAEEKAVIEGYAEHYNYNEEV